MFALLFIIVVDVLNNMLVEVEEGMMLKGFEVGK